MSKSKTVDAAPIIEPLAIAPKSDFQKESLQKLMNSGFPTTKVEEWKYTRIDALLGKELKASNDVDAKPEYIDNTYTLVYVNGNLSESLSKIDGLSGVEIKNLSEADPKLFSVGSDSAADAFANLNGAILTNGSYIKVCKNTAVDKPLHLLNITTEDIYSNVRFVIEVETGSEIEIIEDYRSSNTEAAFSNSVTDVHVAKNSVVRHVKNQAQNKTSFHVGAVNATQERDSTYSSTVLACGSQISRNFLSTQLNDEDASTELKGLYAIKENQLADNHTAINHNCARTFSDQLYKGILDDRSRGVFNGKVFIARDAQQVDSAQLNKNLMLSDKARVDTKPELDVYADDVKAAHGAAIGQLNDEELFYIQSRCISKEAAMAMLVHGHMEEIIETVKSESVKEYLENIYLTLFDK